MRFTTVLSMLLPAALMGTALGSKPVDTSEGTIYSPREYSFEDYGNGTLAVMPLNGKRQIKVCDVWNSWVVCQGGLSDTYDCTNKYCSCVGSDLVCQSGTTCSNTCECEVYCA